jgi:hypothetical protein
MCRVRKQREKVVRLLVISYLKSERKKVSGQWSMEKRQEAKGSRQKLLGINKT